MRMACCSTRSRSTASARRWSVASANTVTAADGARRPGPVCLRLPAGAPRPGLGRLGGRASPRVRSPGRPALRAPLDSPRRRRGDRPGAQPRSALYSTHSSPPGARPISSTALSLITMARPLEASATEMPTGACRMTAFSISRSSRRRARAFLQGSFGLLAACDVDEGANRALKCAVPKDGCTCTRPGSLYHPGGRTPRPLRGPIAGLGCSVDGALVRRIAPAIWM